ncbi:MAG: mechanosensitive ion channel domain-containing protein [Acetobacteraceae bacterium]
MSFKTYFIACLLQFRAYFGWLPASVVTVVMLVTLALIAFYASHWMTRFLLRLLSREGSTVARKIVLSTRRSVRLIIVLVVVISALPAASGLSWRTTQILQKSFVFIVILMVGYSAIKAFRIMTEAYLSRISLSEHHDDIIVRSHQTQIKVLQRLLEILVGIITVGVALMTFDSVRNYGVSLFASAGAASLIVGLSARGLLTNLLAGVQIAITQPIRMEDLIIINGDWTWVEEITATYVVLRVWDWRRHIVPISYFLENRFENWTHNSAAIIGIVYLYLDYEAPIDALREELQEIAKTCPLWDGKVLDFQVADCDAVTIKIRIIASARSALKSWDLRCDIREKMIKRIREDYPEALSRHRLGMVTAHMGREVTSMGEDEISPPIDRPPPRPHSKLAKPSGPKGG